MGNIVNSLLGASYNEGKITFVLRALYEARDRYVQYQAMIDKNIQESWAKRKEEDKCQRLKCRKRRKDKDNWIQCSRCRVASYFRRNAQSMIGNMAITNNIACSMLNCQIVQLTTSCNLLIQ